MNNLEKQEDFIQKNSPDGGFLQSAEWREFQQSVGKKTSSLNDEDFSASIIEHQLPIVGKYFYLPRGPITLLEGKEFPISNFQFPIKSQIQISNDQIKCGMQEVIALAKKENAGWIRIEPANNESLELIRKSIKEKIVRAPHDMQPKEIFVIDIAKSPEELLAEMKAKTRYNIGVAKKKGVIIKSDRSEEIIEAFLELTREMAQRQGIATHGEGYYRKMIASFPSEMLKIYVAEYEGKIIAANLVLFFGKFATYLHGASGNNNRNVMAPFLLQWQAILDAKERGCERYDFGGVQTPEAQHQMHSNLVGVTNFKLGFSPLTKPIEFPGSYDIVVNSRAYALYRGLQRVKYMVGRFRR